MEPLVLKDPSVEPTDKLIFSIIGDKKVHWQAVMEGIRKSHPDANGQWNYYRDGKNWLFKMQNKKKTIFWLGVLQGAFRITFYFGDKAEPLIEQSDLPESIKEAFRSGKRYGKIRGISNQINTDEDVKNVLKLSAIRTALK